MMSSRLHSFVFVAALAAFTCNARAQTQTATPAPSPAPAPQQQTTATTSVEDADLSITARVTAREVRFEKVPNPKVEFTGKPRRETVWQTERENLPAEVRPGVTYRDIGIRLRITSVFADIDRIVAEALGERPVTDEPQPAPQPQPQPQTEQPPAQPPSAPVASVTPRASLASPAAAPATNNAPTRQRRGTTRGGRHR